MENHSSNKRSLDVVDQDKKEEPPCKKLKSERNEQKSSHFGSEDSKQINSEKEIKIWNLIALIVYELLVMLRQSAQYLAVSTPSTTSLDQNENNNVQENLSNDIHQNDRNKLSNSTNCAKKLKKKSVMGKRKKKKKTLSELDIMEAVNPNKMNSFKYTVNKSLVNLKDLDTYMKKTENISVQSESTNLSKSLRVKEQPTQFISTPSNDIDKKNIGYDNNNSTNKSNIASDDVQTKLPMNDMNNVAVVDNQTNKLTQTKAHLNLHDILKMDCMEGLLNRPKTKPVPCSCNYCVFVDNLPNNESLAMVVLNNNSYNKFSNTQHLNLPSDHLNMFNNTFYNGANVPNCQNCASNSMFGMPNNCYCTISKVDLRVPLQSIDRPANRSWVDNLILLIKTNREVYNIPKENNIDTIESETLESESEVHITEIMNKVRDAAEKIKAYLPLCEYCGKSKLSYSSECDCSLDNVESLNYDKAPIVDFNCNIFNDNVNKFRKVSWP
ncbi:hybrid signal transduction histidine kinase A-like isoform X2 [Adelges cooleyi]|uniref:hybrid signal transduction histidine kinase A-like isoform X2 n=1 Tax=Adelges cooleyi TaxID=133065 RepID=UPI002180263E|nr:hybrid signal transduction histidine kinase A-like isoform X2 [Adelges cooleyi]